MIELKLFIPGVQCKTDKGEGRPKGDPQPSAQFARPNAATGRDRRSGPIAVGRRSLQHPLTTKTHTITTPHIYDGYAASNFTYIYSQGSQECWSSRWSLCRQTNAPANSKGGLCSSNQYWPYIMCSVNTEHLTERDTLRFFVATPQSHTFFGSKKTHVC